MWLHKICPLGYTMTKHMQPRSAAGLYDFLLCRINAADSHVIVQGLMIRVHHVKSFKILELFPFVKRTINNKLCSAAQLFLLFFYDFNAWMENQMQFHCKIARSKLNLNSNLKIKKNQLTAALAEFIKVICTPALLYDL